MTVGRLSQRAVRCRTVTSELDTARSSETVGHATSAIHSPRLPDDVIPDLLPAPHGDHCSPMRTTWSPRTVIQNIPLPARVKVASLARLTGMSWLLPASWLAVMAASARTGSVRSLGLTLRE